MPSTDHPVVEHNLLNNRLSNIQLHPSVIPSTLSSLSTSIESGTLSAQLKGHLFPEDYNLPDRHAPSSIDYKKINILTRHHHPTSPERPL